jgi:hypothetical protein
LSNLAKLEEQIESVESAINRLSQRRRKDNKKKSEVGKKGSQTKRQELKDAAEQLLQCKLESR